MSFTLINTLDDLDCLNEELLNKPFIGIDTEFRRTTKENMQLALLQINDEEEIYILDPLSIGPPGESCSFLFSGNVLKIFHSLREDIEAIYSWTGSMMNNLFDTQLANAFLDGDFSIGYSGLVKNTLDIQIDKSETRSNWIRRPLTDAQLNYAASDVEFLIEIYLKQANSLVRENKMDWLKEEINFLSSKLLSENNDSETISSGLSKSDEQSILVKFNLIVEEISRRYKINQTLFFSKKNQKDFLYLTLEKGLDNSLATLTKWRSNLIEQKIKKIFLEI